MIHCSVSAAELEQRLRSVRSRIAEAGGDPEKVKVLGVTKGFDRSAVELARSVGLADLGENYAQELVAKAAGFVAGVRWHAIGRLQRNKVRLLAPHVALWQSVDRARMGAEIAARAPGAEVLVQVNVSGEENKGGCLPSDTATLVADLTADGLHVLGLMAVGASGPPEAARPGFVLLGRLADEIGLPLRSMGMSGDLEVAVAEGATMVRVGTALFGPRSVSGALGN